MNGNYFSIKQRSSNSKRSVGRPVILKKYSQSGDCEFLFSGHSLCVGIGVGLFMGVAVDV